MLPRRTVRIGAPVPRPGKILGVARNYAAHAAERGQSEPPKEPVLFLKAQTAVIGPEDDVVLPAATRQVDYEGELAVVIGRAAREVEAPDALAYASRTRALRPARHPPPACSGFFPRPRPRLPLSRRES